MRKGTNLIGIEINDPDIIELLRWHSFVRKKTCWNTNNKRCGYEQKLKSNLLRQSIIRQSLKPTCSAPVIHVGNNGMTGNIYSNGYSKATKARTLIVRAL